MIKKGVYAATLSVLDENGSLDIDETMSKVINMKVENELRVQSPLIWSSIMKELGIYLIYAPVTGRITRYRASEQQMVAQYGDIS